MGFMMMTVTQYQEICDRKVEFGWHYQAIHQLGDRMDSCGAGAAWISKVALLWSIIWTALSTD